MLSEHLSPSAPWFHISGLFYVYKAIMFTMMGGNMGNQQTVEASKPVVFGRRKVRPRACLADGKQHIRTFLAEALEELGFITCECAHVDALPAILDGLHARGLQPITASELFPQPLSAPEVSHR